MQTSLYPLQFHTLYHEKIWGGQKIRTELNKDFGSLANCGETWEVSGVEGNISIVKEGALAGQSLIQILEEYQGDFVGKHVYEMFGSYFPLLIKFIDANDDLSIQVHPNDALAKQRHNAYGKTEMWYVLQADPKASLIVGFNQDVNQEIYQEKLSSGQLTTILNREEVQAGDIYFLPAGRIHTIGKGLLIAEIQQTSDITYRIYDFDRVDAQGNTRQLHTEEALEAIDYKSYPQYKTTYNKGKNTLSKAVTSPYFITSVLDFDVPVVRDHSAKDSFVIYICVEGSLQLTWEDGEIEMRKGDVVLVPACIENIALQPKDAFKVLESYIPLV